jgi:hypothetical protein
LFITNSSDWRSTQNDDCGKQGQSTTLSCWFRVPTRGGRRRLTLQIQAVVLQSVGGQLVPGRYFLQPGRRPGVYWSATGMVVLRHVAGSSPIGISQRYNRQPANGTACRSKTSNYTFFPGLGQEFYIDVAQRSYLLKATTRHQGIC